MGNIDEKFIDSAYAEPQNTEYRQAWYSQQWFKLCVPLAACVMIIISAAIVVHSGLLTGDNNDYSTLPPFGDSGNTIGEDNLLMHYIDFDFNQVSEVRIGEVYWGNAATHKIDASIADYIKEIISNNANAVIVHGTHNPNSDPGLVSPVMWANIRHREINAGFGEEIHDWDGTPLSLWFRVEERWYTLDIGEDEFGDTILYKNMDGNSENVNWAVMLIENKDAFKIISALYEPDLVDEDLYEDLQIGEVSVNDLSEYPVSMPFNTKDKDGNFSEKDDTISLFITSTGEIAVTISSAVDRPYIMKWEEMLDTSEISVYLYDIEYDDEPIIEVILTKEIPAVLIPDLEPDKVYGIKVDVRGEEKVVHLLFAESEK